MACCTGPPIKKRPFTKHGRLCLFAQRFPIEQTQDSSSGLEAEFVLRVCS